MSTRSRSTTSAGNTTYVRTHNTPLAPLTLLLQIVYVCWIAFEFVFLYFFIVETKGLSLEETAALFDGEDAAAQIHAAAVTEVRSDDVLDEKGSV